MDLSKLSQSSHSMVLLSILAAKDNISEVIGEIQLHTIDNVIKNCIDRVGYCMASRGSHLYKIILNY